MLGSHASTEARIDLIAQAWSVLSGVAPPALQRMAMTAVQTQLMDADAGLIRLLDPPLVHAEPSAGYIQAYPPGVRENGGQYSHAAVWTLMAQAQLHVQAQAQAQGQSAGAQATVDPAGADAAYRSFTWLSPAHRASHPTRGAAYGIEPYAVAGDVYSQPPYVGRGGWSWYTGAAAWLHRAAVESIFGLQLQAQSLQFNPCLPSHWPLAELSLRRDGLQLRFILARGASLAAIRAMAPADAATLAPGQPLAWRTLSSGSHCFLLPLLDPVPNRQPASALAAPD